MLPREKISIAVETKKVYAFSANGTIQSIRTLLNMVKRSPESTELFQTLLQSMAFADHLLAYHAPELMDELIDFLKQVVQETSSEEIKQAIWRILIVGWFKFARDAKSAMELLSLILVNSKPQKRLEPAETEESK